MLNTKEIQSWLISHIAKLLDVAPATIDIRETFSNYGFSSLDVVSLSGDLEDLLGRRLSPTLAYDYPSILALSDYLAGNAQNKKNFSKLESLNSAAAEPIAIIGIACRFPGAADPDSFWQLLRDGLDMIREVPADRWEKNAFYDPDPAAPGKSVSYWGGFLDSIDQFDPFFFGISPIEAKQMDPQQRLLLELSYEAFDDAGKIKEYVSGTKTGVFIGISSNEYSQLQFGDPSTIASHSGTGSALSIAANRISYFFNLHGPSMAIDTACSSSLAAVHSACQSIRNGECEMALAGGVNVILSPANSIAFTKAGVLAPDGRCKTFDALANGYVRGEGGGVIVLKALSSALADGDHVHAVILGSAIQQDGRTNGLMAPSSEGQETMLRAAYKSAGISPADVQYIETHGTGTLLGDSMEAKALGAVIGVDKLNRPCAIGSVKTNIGHLEAAAGIAGLIKVILSLQHRTIPPSLHYHSPNPHIAFDELKLKVNKELTEWPSGENAALAGVSSFGFGGTNVHMIIREAPQKKQKEEKKRKHSTVADFHLLPLSANSPSALHSLARAFRKLLAPGSSFAASDICHSASRRRSQFDYRLAVVGSSNEELISGLQAFENGEPHPNLFYAGDIAPRPRRLAFVFSGQGGQWLGMCRQLLKQEPVFNKSIEQIDDVIQHKFGWSLIGELCAEKSVSRLNEIDVVQPALFAMQVALAQLWQSWGINPDAVVGHSMGEVAAAHVAGVLSLEDAIQVVCRRSQILTQLSRQGCMMLTELSPDQATELINGYGDDIALAVINSPTSTVLSGNPVAMKKLRNSLERQNLFCKMVNVDVASHSAQIDSLRSELQEALKGLKSYPPNLPIYSTLTGTLATNLRFNADYWIDNLRKPVLLSDAIGTALEDEHSIFIEIGPHPVLLSAIQQTAQSLNRQVKLLPSLRREEPHSKILLAALGTLYAEGFSIDWIKFCPPNIQYVPLPVITWQRQRYWLDTKPAGSQNKFPKSENSHPLLGERMNLAHAPSTYVWQPVFDDEVLNLLHDHIVENEVVFPAAGYIEMALQASKETGVNQTHELCDFVFHKVMVTTNGKANSIQVILSPENEGSLLFKVYSRGGSEENWILHASANFILKKSLDNIVSSINIPPKVIREKSKSQYKGQEFYHDLQARGLSYGPYFRGVEQVWSYDQESLGLIRLPASIKYDKNVYQIHPVLLDSCIQVLAAVQVNSFGNDLYLPTGCKRISFFSQSEGLLWSHVSLNAQSSPGNNVIIADIRLIDGQNQIVAEFIGFQLHRTTRPMRNLLTRQDTWLYQVRWQVQRSDNRPLLQEKRHWLIFADDEGLADDLAKQLEAGGDSFQLLSYDEANKNQDYTDEATLLETIEKKLALSPSPISGIIHLWSLSIPEKSSQNSRCKDQIQMRGCNSVLLLVQALAKRLAASPLLYLVTRSAQPVKPGEQVAIEQSSLWGLGKVISFELPELKCIRIDLDCTQSVKEAVTHLVNQLSINDREDQVAFRGGLRFVPRLLPFAITKSPGKPAVSLRADSTYMITGGTGGLGHKTAEWMIQRGARHVVLLGRRRPSPSIENIIDQLRCEGVEIAIEQADVSDLAQLKTVIDKIESTMPPLRGVIHAAGVLDDGSILNLNVQRMKNVMAPKVDGTWNLHHATLHLSLDFFVLFSSAVSVLGSPGQGNYAAASSYLDAMAHYRRSLGLPAISINWGPWAEVGLAFEVSEKLLEQNGSNQHLIKVIKIQEGLQILEELLTDPTPQVVVLPFDLKNLLQLYPTTAGMAFFAEIERGDTRATRLYARPNLRKDYVAPRNEIEHKLSELWRQTLHIDRVGVQDSFFELGGDSVLAAQILSLAQKAFGIRINPQEAFKAFTIERLAKMLEVEILCKIDAMSEDEALRQLSK